MKKTFAFIISLLFCMGTVFAAPPSKGTKPVLLKGSVNQLLYLCASAGITLDKDALPATVTKIRLGSPASYYGVSENDRIEGASVENNMLKLILKRQGASLEVAVPVSAQALRDSTNSGLTAKKSQTNLQIDANKIMADLPEPVMVANAETERKLQEERGALEKFKLLCAQASKDVEPKKKSVFKDVKVLSEYDVVLILDCSGSMAQKIAANIFESRWTWARNQMISLSSQMENVLKKGVILMPFTDKYQIYQPCYGGEVQRIFLQRKPDGGTNLFPPLQDALSRAILKKRPMVITIITDGGFGFKQEIKDLIIAAANGSAGPYDLRINFMILDDKLLPPEIYALDRLTADGAKYDIVEIWEIERLRSKGLQQAIVESLTR